MQNRGKRIYPQNKSLLKFRFSVVLLLNFSVIFLLFYGNTLTTFSITVILGWRLWGSLITTLLLCSSIGYYLYRYRIDEIKQLMHRQKLARMIIDNGWCDIENVKQESFFKDLPSNKTKQKIRNFPKCYYKMKNGIIHITVEITLSKAQDQLLHLEKKLESALFCELIDKELLENYIHYSFLYDTISRRITIDKAKAENGKLRLMDSLYWEYDALPHMLVAGGTGSGKTYFLLTIIKALVEIQAKLYILDPKNSDLADLQTIMDNVYYKKEDMILCINDFVDNMMKRMEEMKQHSNYQTGKNYAYLGLQPNFLVFDEFVAFMDLLGRESLDVMSKIKQIVMLGRQAGFFIILACQRPDAKYLGDGARDQFNFRVALGRMSELGYTMLFGETNKDYFLKKIRGRGYVDVGTSVISEFYTPLVPKEYDFLAEINNALPVLEDNSID